MRKNVIATLEYMAGRCSILQAAQAGEAPVSAADRAMSVKGWVDHALATEKMADADRIAALKEAQNDENWADRLFEARVTEVDNYLRSTSNWIGLMFETEVLGPNDFAMFENKSKTEISCGYLAENGEPRAGHVIAARTKTPFKLRYVASDWHEYPLDDLNLGTGVGEEQSSMVDIGEDLKFQIDQMAFTMFKAAPSSGGALGSFTTTGVERNRTFHLHSSIQSGNLPTTNVLQCSTASYSLASASGSTKFNLDVMREIIGYYSQYGNIAWPGSPGPLGPTGVIIVNSKDAGHLGLAVNPLTVNTDNQILQQLFRDYRYVDYQGVRWVLVPDVTIGQHVCYPVPNKPVGKVWLKPYFDKNLTERDLKKGLERRMQARGFACAIPKQWTPRVCSVRYNTTGA